MAHLTRCHCAECTTLDRLPTRRQGIPGAYQMTFDNAHHESIDWPEVDRYQPIGPRQIATADTLPLFAPRDQLRLI